MTTSDLQPEGASRDGSPIATGDLVITWWDEEPVEYGGPGEGGPLTTLSFSPGLGRPPVLQCDPKRVAPAGTPIPAQDPRVMVTKRPTADKPYGAAGTWRLTLPGQEPSWHKTKRDGTAAGLRRVAILDWHAAQAGPAPHPLQEDRYLPNDR
jgi:hypothetical protein